MGDVVPAEPGWYAVGWAEGDDGLVATASRVVAWLIEGISSVRPVTFDGAPARRHSSVVFMPGWERESLAAGDFMFKGSFRNHEPSDDQVALLSMCRAHQSVDSEAARS